MSRIPDNYDLWERHDAEQQRSLKNCPQCDICDKHIQEDFYWEFDGVIYCCECLGEHRKWVEDYVG